MTHPKKPSRRQAGYLRYLERACDVPCTLGLTIDEATTRITKLELQYRIIFDRQPAMRGA